MLTLPYPFQRACGRRPRINLLRGHSAGEPKRALSSSDDYSQRMMTPTRDTLRRREPPPSPGLLRRAWAAISASRAGLFFSRHVNWKLDPLLLEITGGRLAGTLIFPTAVLETEGARTGIVRRNAVIYWHDGDRVIIAASNGGSPRHPAWYYNLIANPDVTFGGRALRAEPVPECDRQRVWALGDRVFPAYARMRRTAGASGRSIPLVQLVARP